MAGWKRHELPRPSASTSGRVLARTCDAAVVQTAQQYVESSLSGASVCGCSIESFQKRSGLVLNSYAGNMADQRDVGRSNRRHRTV